MSHADSAVPLELIQAKQQCEKCGELAELNAVICECGSTDLRKIQTAVMCWFCEEDPAIGYRPSVLAGTPKPICAECRQIAAAIKSIRERKPTLPHTYLEIIFPQGANN